MALKLENYEYDDDQEAWECPAPEPTHDEPWVTDPECAGCGHRMSCCDSDHSYCECNDDDEGEDF